MFGWAVYIGDERYAWFEQEWIAEDMVKDLQNISEYEERDVYYIWERK